MSLASMFPIVQWDDDTGVPLAAGFVYTYAAGTTTALATYADALFAAANPNPLVLNAAGRGVMFLLPMAYKFVVKDSLNVQVGPTYDNIQMQGAGEFTVTAIQTTYTATYEDDIIIVTTGGPFTITLPTAVNHAGKTYTVKNLTATTITIDPNGSETIDGAATYAGLTGVNDSVTFYSDGSNWKIQATHT